MMQPYKNVGGNSGVRAYEIGADSITVQFTEGATYLYTYGSAGSDAIERMKTLAAAGSGLNSYISRTVKKGYARKLS